jgi:hypothetical protein
MKFLAFALVLALVCLASPTAAQQSGTYKGQIMDSACAKNGSHAAMTKNNPNMTAKDCTTACVSHGAQYVLYDPGTKTVYILTDQKKPEQFAGAPVIVTGTLDPATKTITVVDIKPAA